MKTSQFPYLLMPESPLLKTISCQLSHLKWISRIFSSGTMPNGVISPPHTVRKELSKLPREAVCYGSREGPVRKYFWNPKKEFQIQLILSNPASYSLCNLQISVKSKSQNYCQIRKKKLFLIPRNYWESENIFLNRKIFSNPTFIFWSINLSLSPKKSRKVFWNPKKKKAKPAHVTVSGWQLGNQTTRQVPHVGLSKCMIHQLTRLMIHLNNPT